MSDLLQWLMANPTLTNGAFSLLGLILLTVLVMYVVAFRQGREINFWPPHIGPHQKHANLGKEKLSKGESQRVDQKAEEIKEVVLPVNADGKVFRRFNGWKTIESEIAYNLEHSKEVRMIKIKGRGLYTNIKYKRALIARTRAGKFTQILLQTPASKYITQEVSDAFDWDTLNRYITEFYTVLDVIAGMLSNYKHVVRLYDALPLLKLYLFDNDIYLSIYTGTADDNKDAIDVWHLSRKGNQYGLPRLIQAYFETLWDESINLSLVQNKAVIFDDEKYFLSIPVLAQPLNISKDRFSFRQKEFSIKREFHITIIGTELGSVLKEQVENDPAKKDAFLRAIAETNWSYEPCNKFYHLVEDKTLDDGTIDHLETIIQMANIPALDAFYKQLANIFKVEIPPRPTHITLFTYGSEVGIGVATQDEFDQFCHGEINPKDFIEIH